MNLTRLWRKNMVLLIDINVLLDYLLKRENFYDDAKKIIDFCGKSNIDGCIALHTVTTLWYIFRKVPDEKRRLILKGICDIFDVVATTHDEVVNAVNNSDFKDFEDCIQTKCAKTANADYIITRNPDDFLLSEVPVLTPKDAIAIFSIL